MSRILYRNGKELLREQAQKFCDEHNVGAWHSLVDDITDLLFAERERCAKVAENYKLAISFKDEDGPVYITGSKIAAAIRAGKEPK